MRDSRKNVLVIITDQQRASEIFTEEGEGALELPAMKRLRKHGLSFANTVCNTCMCSPSRSTLFTGRYPAQHGVTQTLSYGGKYAVGQHSLDYTLPNMGNIFANAGYDVQYRGKWHLSKAPNSPEDPNALMASDVAMFGFKGWIPPDAGEDAAPEHFGGGWPNQDARYIAEAKEWLSARKESGDEQPFLMVLSLVNPHDVLGYPNAVQYGYHPADWERRNLKLPPNFREDLATNNKPSAQAQLLASAAYMLGPLPGPEDKLNYLNFYGTLCERVDRQIDEVLELFFDKDKIHGEKPNQFFNDTLILRMADHGEMGMSHGGMRQKAFNVYEETMRVPMVWSNPDMFERPQVTNSLMSLVDVLPTLCSALIPDKVPDDTVAGFAGADMTPVLADPKASVQEQILFTFDDIRASSATQEVVVHAPDRIRCVRTENWKYAEYFSADSSYPPEYELYDLNAPTEGNGIGKNGLEYDNLYYDADGKPNHGDGIRALVADMRGRLQTLMEEKLYGTAPPPS